jgi:predicted DCC family thiol-disulfide oxidoreductase YuxK
MQQQEEHIIIFDGVCNFCNASIDFIMRHDRNSIFLFTANQNPKGQEILARYGVPVEEVGTVYYLEGDKLHNKSSAALRIARRLSFPYKLAFGFMIVPRFIRDAVYSLIARNRYNWFGKKETCRIPSPEEAARFI